jgi:hypothetical protein
LRGLTSLNVRGLHLLLRGKQFLQSKRQGTGSTKQVGALLKPIKEQSMEYLILVAVVSMMALYALIIVGCLKQPEW